MIVAKRKPIEEIIEEVKDYEKILVAGCNECVTVCESGGKKEVAVLASALRMYFMNQGKDIKIDEVTLERQCDHEYLEEIRNIIDQYEAVISLACGVGAVHINLICSKCGKIEDFDQESTVHADKVRTQFGFEVLDYRMEYYGVCADCRARRTMDAGDGR